MSKRFMQSGRLCVCKQVIARPAVCTACIAASCKLQQEKKKKRKYYAFRRQFGEKPSMIPGCPDAASYMKKLTLQA